jgi:dUTP pyrophosphatase
MTGIMIDPALYEKLIKENGGYITTPSSLQFYNWKPKIKVKRLTENAIMPTKAHEFDAGFDLYCNEDFAIDHFCRKVISTGISMAIPQGYVGLIWPRSGLATKSGIDTLAGVVDHGYTGEVKVCLFNTDDFKKFNAGDKIAQILIQQIGLFELQEVESLDASERGEKGFGSSG